MIQAFSNEEGGWTEEEEKEEEELELVFSSEEVVEEEESWKRALNWVTTANQEVRLISNISINLPRK